MPIVPATPYRHVTRNMELLATATTQGWTPCDGCKANNAFTRLLCSVRSRATACWDGRVLADCKASITVESHDGATLTLGGEKGETFKTLLRSGAEDLFNAVLEAGEGGAVEVTVFYQGDMLTLGCTFVSTYDPYAPWEAYVVYRYSYTK